MKLLCQVDWGVTTVGGIVAFVGEEFPRDKVWQGAMPKATSRAVTLLDENEQSQISLNKLQREMLRA